MQFTTTGLIIRWLRTRKKRTMEVLITNDSPLPEQSVATLEERAKKVLSASGCDDAEVSVWLCDDQTIRELHNRWFGIDEPTNVISFAQREGEFTDIDPEMLGDIVISYDTAYRDATEAGKKVEDELLFLLIHGILHLLGYDHEGDNAHRAPEMEAREEELYLLAIG